MKWGNRRLWLVQGHSVFRVALLVAFLLGSTSRAEDCVGGVYDRLR